LRRRRHTLLACALLAGAASEAAAQLNLMGYWNPIFHEDFEERVPGPAMGDYLGLPITDAARKRADSWDASILSLPEHQCKPHPSTYGFRGVGLLRIWEERDPRSQALLKINTHIQWQEQRREIWMDGREHPPEHAPHSWQGFSTGRYEGDVLVVRTTHLKAGWMRRNGLPLSDRATMTDRFYRHGDVVTHVMIVEDPVYLSEPLVKTNGFRWVPNGAMTPYPCDAVTEVLHARGYVPHFLPGRNPFLREFAETHGLPFEATRGGAHTALPEYMPAAGAAAAARPPQAPSRPPPENAVIDVTGHWVAIVNEDWRWRMVTPPKGDVTSVPLNAEGRRAAEAWDPAEDGACAAYGAAALLRMPTRLSIEWSADDVLTLRTDAGSQTRELVFADAPPPAAAPSLQGDSRARWIPTSRPPGGFGAAARPPAPGGSLQVVTTHLSGGWLRRNGVPYGADAVVTEYFDRFPAPNGDQWLMVTTIVEDPAYLDQPYVTSSHFKREPDASRWRPTRCRS